MAFSFFVNQTPATGAVAMYTFIAKLIAQGWLKKMDSDGTTYSSTGAQVTSGAAGAGGLGNSNAWVRLQRPDAGAELVIQRGASNQSWRMYYVEGDTFTGGAPAAAVTPATPSGTKEGYIIGGGTNAAPTFGASMLPGDGTYKMQGGADGASPYGFWFGGYSAIGVAPNFGMVYEPLVQTEAGDPSPYVFVVFVSTSTPFSKVEIGSTTAPTSINSPKAVGYIGAVATANWVAVPGCAQLDGAGNTLYPGGAGVGPFTAKDNTAPIRFGRSSSIGAPAADKGTSTIMRWAGVNRAASGDVGSFATTLDRILFKDVWLNWDTVTTPT
jgi:hypothetical protein